MNAIDRIKMICEQRGISISKLERECGFANAYIAGLRKGTMPADRLQKVADFLGVSYAYLLTGEEDEGTYYVNPETADMAQELYDNKDLRLLFDASRNATPEQLRLIRDLVLQMTKGNRVD